MASSAWLVLLPLNVVGSTLGDIQAGRVSGLARGRRRGRRVLPSTASSSAIYVSVFLLPFGAGWIVTFVLLRRALGR